MKKKKLKLKSIIEICIAAAFVAALVLVILFRMGIFNKRPTVAVYSEISEGESLRVLADKNYSPYSFIDSDGKASGYDIELITVIANRLGMKLELIFFDDWNEAKTDFEGGKAEILLTCDSNDEISGAILSVSTSDDDFIVYSKSSVSSINQLYKKKIAIVEDGNVLPHLEMLGLSGNCRYYQNNELVMTAVANGEADCAIMRQNMGNAFISRKKFSGIKEQISVGHSYLCCGIRSDREDLALNVNRTVEELRRNGEIEKLGKKWLTTFVKPYTFWEVLKNNPWVVIAFVLLLIYTLWAINRKKHIRIKEHEEQRKELNEKLRIIGGLASEYTALFYINLNDGTYVNYIATDRISDVKNSLDVYTKFTDLYRNYVDGDKVHPDYREQLHQFYRSEAQVKEELKDRKKISSVYKRKYGEDYLWTEMILVKCEDIHDDAQTVIAGFNEINDEYIKRMEDEENERQAKATSAMIDRFVTEFDVSYRVNVKEDTFKVLKAKHENSQIITSRKSFSELFSDYSSHVFEEDREEINKNLDIHCISDRIRTESEYNVRYRGMLTGHPVWHDMRILKLNDSEVIIGFMNIDDTITRTSVRTVLTENYYDVYVIDTVYDVLSVVRSESDVLDIVKDGTTTVYSEIVPKFLEIIPQKNREEWEVLKTPEGVRQFMGSEDKRELMFESSFRDGKFVRCSWFVLERTEGLASKVCFTFSDLDEAQTDREKLNEKIAEQGAFTSYFLEAYQSAYYVSLDTLKYQIYKRTSGLDEKYPLTDNFLESLDTYIDSEVHPDDRDELKELTRPGKILEKLSEQNQFYYVYREKSEDKERTLRLQIIRGADDRHAAFGFRDITKSVLEQEAYQIKLQNALSEAQSANRAKSSFLFNMSHDIRTPMNAIIGFTDMAVKRIDDKDKVLDYLSKVKQSGTLLLSLINGVLDMSRIESGKAELEENPGDVYLAFSVMEDSMIELAKQKDISISFTFGEIRDRFIFCDFSRTTRVMVNLVSNAIKYTNAGGTVKVSCEQIGTKDGSGIYKFEVADNGIGMSEEFIPHVFEAYSREHNTTTSKIQGTGLGLSVCKTFVEAMGGTIECRSEQGKGSTFTVILPFKLQKEHIYTDPKTGSVVTAASENDIKTTNFAGKRVLLVEDNDLNREIALDLLTDEGLIVDEADDGTVAVQKIDEKGPYYYDLVLMDIQMPIMNGYEATRIIRLKYPDVKIPIIALSANAFEEDRKASREAGMDAHVVKPIDVQNLFETMNGLVR